MARLALSILGTAKLRVSGVGAWELSPASWPLLGLLMCQPGQRATRSLLASALWPDKDEEAGRHCLATALWRCKRAFKNRDPLVSSTADMVELAGRPWTDVEAFRHRIAAGLDPARAPDRCARQLRAALSLYRGPLLDGVYADAVLLERERVECLRLDALHALAVIEANSGNWEAAIEAARALCALEPLREDGHRLLMRAYAANGNRALALRQYRICADVLERDLGVVPMPETQALEAELSGRPALAAFDTDGIYRSLVAARNSLEITIQSLDSAISAARSLGQ